MTKELTPEKIMKWLQTHGGRSIEDLKEDEQGYYVEMYSPILKIRKVYIK